MKETHIQLLSLQDDERIENQKKSHYYYKCWQDGRSSIKKKTSRQIKVIDIELLSDLTVW